MAIVSDHQNHVKDISLSVLHWVEQSVASNVDDPSSFPRPVHAHFYKKALAIIMDEYYFQRYF